MRKVLLLAPIFFFACGGPDEELVETQSAQSADDGWLRLVRLKLYQDMKGEVVTDHGLSIRAERTHKDVEIVLSGPKLRGTVNLEVRVDCSGAPGAPPDGNFQTVHDKDYVFSPGQKAKSVKLTELCPPRFRYVDQLSVDAYLLKSMRTDEFITPSGTARHLYITRDSYVDGVFYTDDARLGVKGGHLRILQTTQSDDRRKMHLRYYNRTSNQDYEVQLDIRTRCRRPSTGATTTVDTAARTVWVDAGENAEVTVVCPVDYRVDFTEAWFQVF